MPRAQQTPKTGLPGPGLWGPTPPPPFSWHQSQFRQPSAGPDCVPCRPALTREKQGCSRGSGASAHSHPALASPGSLDSAHVLHCRVRPNVCPPLYSHPSAAQAASPPFTLSLRQPPSHPEPGHCQAPGFCHLRGPGPCQGRKASPTRCLPPLQAGAGDRKAGDSASPNPYVPGSCTLGTPEASPIACARGSSA